MVVLCLQSSGISRSSVVIGALLSHSLRVAAAVHIGEDNILGRGLVYSVTFISSGLIPRPHPLTSKSNLVNKLKFLWQ